MGGGGNPHDVVVFSDFLKKDESLHNPGVEGSKKEGKSNYVSMETYNRCMCECEVVARGGTTVVGVEEHLVLIMGRGV